MATRPGLAQQVAGAAADIEHRRGRHHEREVEAEIAPLVPGAEAVVTAGETGLGELAVDHGASLPNRPGGLGRISHPHRPMIGSRPSDLGR